MPSTSTAQGVSEAVGRMDRILVQLRERRVARTAPV